MSGQDVWRAFTVAAGEALLAAIVFMLIRRYAPATRSGVDPATLASLSNKYAGYEFAGVPALLLFAVAINWVLYRVLRFASDCEISLRRDGAEFVFEPGAIGLCVVMIVPAFLLSLLPMSVLYRLVLGATRYREFSLVSRYEQGYDARRVVLAIATVVTPISLALAVLLVDRYALVTPTELVVNRFWGFTENRRALSDVVAIEAVEWETAPDRNVISWPYHVVRFRDGSEWTTRDLSMPDAEADRPAIEYLAARAAVPIQRVIRPLSPRRGR